MDIRMTIPHVFFVFFRKHECPLCGGIMRRVKMTRNFPTESLEAKQFFWLHSIGPSSDYGWPGGGKTTILWCDFQCGNCGYQTSVETMYQLWKKTKASRKSRR